MLSAACLASALFLLFPATASAEESGAESLADQIGVFGLTEILGQAYPLWLAIVALALYGGAIVALMAFLIARAAPSEKPAKKQESEEEKLALESVEEVAPVAAVEQPAEAAPAQEQAPAATAAALLPAHDEEEEDEEVEQIWDIEPLAKPAPVEGPAPVEEAAPIEEPTPVEEAAPIEEPAPVEEAAPVEEPAPVEEAAPIEEPAPVEEAAPIEEPAPVEEAAPIEEPAPVEEAAPIEEVAPVEEPAPVEEAAPVIAPVAIPAAQEPEEGTAEFYSALEENKKYDRSFRAKLAQASDVVKERYGAVYNMLMAFKGVKSRYSWDCETFKAGGKVVAKVTIIGKTPVLFLALDPEKYADTKYRVEDASKYSKYAPTPARFKVNTERKVGYARDLIAVTMKDFTPISESKELPAIPYQSDEELLQAGLIKVIK